MSARSKWVTCGTTVADSARHLDVTAGPDDRDRHSLPAPAGSYEQAIESLATAGLRARWSPDLGFAMLSLHDNGAVDAELVHPPGLTRYELAALKSGGARFLKDCPPQPAPIEWPSLASLGS